MSYPNASVYIVRVFISMDSQTLVCRGRMASITETGMKTTGVGEETKVTGVEEETKVTGVEMTGELFLVKLF